MRMIEPLKLSCTYTQGYIIPIINYILKFPTIRIPCKDEYCIIIDRNILNKDRNLSYYISICKFRNFGYKVDLIDSNTVTIESVPINIKCLYFLSSILDKWKIVRITKDKNNNPIITFKYNNKEVSFKTFPYGIGICKISETFIEEFYGDFNYSKKTIIDIGGFIGDTSIYFAINGAKKVYVYEPLQLAFKLLKDNIKLNNLDKIIIPKNVAIGSKNGSIEISFSDSILASSGYVANATNCSARRFNVEVQDIISILDSIGNVDIIKLDCDGREYQVINRLVESGYIDKINEGLIIEVHENKYLGKLSDITKPLRDSGFKTKIIKHSKGEINLYILKAWR